MPFFARDPAIRKNQRLKKKKKALFKKQAYAEKNQLIEDAQNFGEDLRSLIEKVRTINVEKIELQGRLNLVSDLVDTNVKNQ